MTKAYSYLRISTDQQKFGDGIRRQLDASAKYAEDQGYELVETISDIGLSAFSGANITEGGLGRFLAAMDAGKIEAGSVLLVESLDRLSRDKVLRAFSQFTNILERGITIITLMDGQVYTSDSVSQNVGQLFTSLGIMLRANEESATKSKRIKASWTKRRETASDKILTGLCPSWLEPTEDRTTFTVKEDAAQTIREIFDLCNSGMGIYSIVRTLSADPVRYPPITGTGKWYSSYVQKLLKGRDVLGEYQPKHMVSGERIEIGDPITNYYPRIISDDVWNLANARMKDRRTTQVGRKGEMHSNLFTSILKCAGCGGNLLMRGTSSNGHSKATHKILRCTNAIDNRHGCTAPSWRYSEFEESFIQFVKEVSFAELMQGEGMAAQLKSLQGTLATESAKSTELGKRYESILDLLERPSLTDMMLARYTERAVEVENEIGENADRVEKLKQEISRIESLDVAAEQKDFLRMYEKLDATKVKDELRRMRFAMSAIISRVVQEIQVNNLQKINPWEVPDLLSEVLIAELKDKSQAKLERYFSTDIGKRHFVKSERYLVVKFKSGAVRVIQPYSGMTFMSVSDRMVKMKRGA